MRQMCRKTQVCGGKGKGLTIVDAGTQDTRGSSAAGGGSIGVPAETARSGRASATPMEMGTD